MQSNRLVRAEAISEILDKKEQRAANRNRLHVKTFAAILISHRTVISLWLIAGSFRVESLDGKLNVLAGFAGIVRWKCSWNL
jgi:hypothetical protein